MVTRSCPFSPHTQRTWSSVFAKPGGVGPMIKHISRHEAYYYIVKSLPYIRKAFGFPESFFFFPGRSGQLTPHSKRGGFFWTEEKEKRRPRRLWHWRGLFSGRAPPHRAWMGGFEDMICCELGWLRGEGEDDGIFWKWTWKNCVCVCVLGGEKGWGAGILVVLVINIVLCPNFALMWGSVCVCIMTGWNKILKVVFLAKKKLISFATREMMG